MFSPLPSTIPELHAERDRLAGWVGYRAYLDTAILGRNAEIDRAERQLLDLSERTTERRHGQMAKDQRIKWLQDRIAGCALGSHTRRRYEDELWLLLDK